MIPPFFAKEPKEEQTLEKTHANPTQAMRELIRRALKGKIDPVDYLQAVQLIREHGDFNLGELFSAINRIESAEEDR